jgi:DNA-binding NarL/FixJ family response regulator
VTTRVVLAEDNALLREGLRGLIAAEDGLELAATCSDLDGLLTAIDAACPDVVLTDIRMPPGWSDEGLRAAEHCRDRHPGTGVVLLSQYVDPGYVTALMDTGPGGRGYLLKERVADVSHLFAALHVVAGGGSVVDPVVVEILVRSRRRSGDPGLARLSPRELEVLAEMARGHSNTAISRSLVVTTRSVEKHINSIFAKLAVGQQAGVHPRVQAVLAYLAAAGRP